MSRYAVVLVLLVALLGVGAASADSGFVIEGIDVKPNKIHFGTVAIGTCSTVQTATCTVRTVTITNTSSAPLFFFQLAASVIPRDAGISLGLDRDFGTCVQTFTFDLGESCTWIVTAGWETGVPGHHKDVALVLFVNSILIAEIPMTVKNVS